MSYPNLPQRPANITDVRGNLVDCHVCRTTFTQPSEYAAHTFAQAHAHGHAVPNPPATPMPVQVHVQQQAPAYPRRAKTTINHTPHIILDIITAGLWIPIHITLAILGGRKTKFR